MPCVASGLAFFWRHSTLCGETSASPKKKKKSLLCVRVYRRGATRERRAVRSCCGDALPEEVRAGGGRGSFLLPTEVCQRGTLREQRSDRYHCLLTDTEAFIQLFILMHAARAGTQAAGGFEASQGAKLVMDGTACLAEQYPRLVALALLGTKSITLYKIY